MPNFVLNPDIVRDRDVIVFSKSKGIPVQIDSALSTSGWPGGQGVRWTDSTSDTLIVTATDGLPAGILLWGSNESSDQFIAYYENQPTYKFATLCIGGWIISTITYEMNTYASRQAGPLIPIAYVIGQPLFFSLRGYFTPEDEWTLSGDPRAPNVYVTGAVAQVPSTLSNNYLGVQTAL
jgi:hypothetical protein